LSLFFRFLNITGHQAIGDGGTNPDFHHDITGELVGGLQDDIDVIQQGNEHVHHKDGPQVSLGIALPVLAGIELSEQDEQHHSKDQAGLLDGIIGRMRRENDIPQQNRDTDT
jgi:hypothetical protein